MGEAISGTLPLAIGVAISPLPIMAIILMLFSERARVNGLSFVVGWMLGLAAVVAVVVALAEVSHVSTEDTPSLAASIIQLGLGVVLLLLGYRNWRKRPQEGEEPSLPKWMASIDRFSPGKAFGLAVLLSAVNPKNLALAVGAGLIVAQAGLSVGNSVVSAAVFVVIASVTVAAPPIIYVALGGRAEKTLASWKAWLAANNAVVMMVLLVVFGVVLIGRGIGGLTGQ